MIYIRKNKFIKDSRKHFKNLSDIDLFVAYNKECDTTFKGWILNFLFLVGLHLLFKYIILWIVLVMAFLMVSQIIYNLFIRINYRKALENELKYRGF
jgi:hypothetical protein